MFIARLHQRFRKQNLVHNQIEKKTNKTYVFHLNWLINMKLSPLSSDPPFQKDSQKKTLQCGIPFSSQVSLCFLLSFFPKELLNRSSNPIPVWRKSQIFKHQLTEDFGPFNVIIRTFGKLQSYSPLS